MSRQLTYELVADGGTDHMLVPVIEWAIHRLDPDVELLEPEFRKRKGAVRDFLAQHEATSMVVFVHRDAETESVDQRLREFDEVDRTNVVPVIPVRMSEAWILFDSNAIGQAAGRPAANIAVPAVSSLESIANPKELLESLLLEAAGSPTGRRRKVFQRSLVKRRINVASLINDFAPLETVDAFARFQRALASAYPYLQSP